MIQRFFEITAKNQAVFEQIDQVTGKWFLISWKYCDEKRAKKGQSFPEAFCPLWKAHKIEGENFFDKARSPDYNSYKSVTTTGCTLPFCNTWRLNGLAAGALPKQKEKDSCGRRIHFIPDSYHETYVPWRNGGEAQPRDRNPSLVSALVHQTIPWVHPIKRTEGLP